MKTDLETGGNCGCAPICCSAKGSGPGETSTEKSPAEKEANKVIAIGTGVGAMGIGTTLLAGITCPLCVVIAPGLIGLGLFQRWRSKVKKAARV